MNKKGRVTLGFKVALLFILTIFIIRKIYSFYNRPEMVETCKNV